VAVKMSARCFFMTRDYRHVHRQLSISVAYSPRTVPQ
jgi:hypothetical protein